MRTKTCDFQYGTILYHILPDKAMLYSYYIINVVISPLQMIVCKHSYNVEFKLANEEFTVIS